MFVLNITNIINKVTDVFSPWFSSGYKTILDRNLRLGYLLFFSIKCKKMLCIKTKWLPKMLPVLAAFSLFFLTKKQYMISETNKSTSQYSYSRKNSHNMLKILSFFQMKTKLFYSCFAKKMISLYRTNIL